MTQMSANTKAKLIVFLNTLTLIGGAITIILLMRVITNAAHQNGQTNNQIVASQKSTENELRCLAAFFSQTNRQNLRISNLEKCEILHTDTGQTETLPLSPTSSSPAVPSTDTNKNSTTTPITTQENTPQTTTSQPTPAPSQIAPQVINQAPPPPKEILGIPICIPFTNRCMR